MLSREEDLRAQELMKPCGLCKGQGKLEHGWDHDIKRDSDTNYYTICDECGFDIGGCTDWDGTYLGIFPTASQAVDAWNAVYEKLRP